MDDNCKTLKDNTIAITKQGGILFTGNFIELFLKFFYSWILAKFLGTEGVGLYFLAFTIINFILLISRAELQEGILKFVSAFKGIGNKKGEKGVFFSAIKLIAIFSTIACIAIFFIADFIALNIFKEPSLGILIKILLISLPLMGFLSIFLSYFQAYLKMKYYVLILSVLQPLSNITLFILFIVFGWHIFGAVYAYIGSLIVALLAAIYFLKKKFDIFDNDIFYHEHTNKLLNFSLPLSLVAILNFFMQWTGLLVLGFFRGAYESGIYSIVIKVSSFTTVFLVAFNSTFAPIISNFYNKNMVSSLEDLFKVITKWTLMLSLPILLLFSIFSKDILSIFGLEFTVGSSALMILMIGKLFDICAGAAYYIILMSGRTRLALINSIVICIINFILSLSLIYKFGFFGGAIASTISLILFSIVTLIEVFLLLRIHPYNVKFFKPLISGVFSIAVFYAVKKLFFFLGINVYSLFFYIIILITYITGLYLLKFDEEDITVINILKRKFSFIAG